MKTKLFTGLSIGMLLLAPVAAQAALTPYPDRTAFDFAVRNTTLIDFEDQPSKHYGGNLTVGDVSFTQAGSPGTLYILETRYSTYPTSNFLCNNMGGSPVTINFTSNVSAVGMDLGWLWPSWNASGSIMDFVLNNGESFIAYDVPGPLNHTSTPLDFVGFSSDIPFSSITIIDPGNSVMIDNFAYSPTPEPATMLLLGTGLAALAGARKLKKQLPA